ncbi:MAG: hypothetical protein RL071_2950, partial [Pseudomonadota bacterium]
AVGMKRANGYGLHDLSGNVFEWVWDVWDWYGAGGGASVVDPVSLATGANRVVRGGSWSTDASSARVSNRGSHTPGYRNTTVGVRLVRTAR